MAVNLSPYGGVGAQFLDNAGNVLTGGKIETYAAGTTTPQATYTSSTGTTFHPNPIILDASGRVPSGGEIWLTDGLLYKFVLRDSSNVLIATYDNIAGINSNFVNFTNQQEIQTATAGQTVFTLTTTNYSPGTNSLSVYVDGVNQYGPGASYAYLETNSTTVTFTTGLHVGAEVKFTTSQSNSSGGTNASVVTYDPAGAGAVATTVQAKLRETVSVKDFGAVGDGVADDTVAIQTAWNACVANDQTLFFPAGSYRITDTLTQTPILFLGEADSAIIFDSFSGKNGITYLPTSTVGQLGGLIGLQLIAKNQNGLVCVEMPKNATQYEDFYTRWVFRDLYCRGTNRNLAAYSVAWDYGFSKWFRLSDCFGVDFENVLIQGQWDIKLDPTGQFQDTGIELDAASALLTARISDVTIGPIYTAVNVGDRAFYSISTFDFIGTHRGIYQTGATVFNEPKISFGNINSQQYGIYLDGPDTRDIDSVTIRRHRDGWKGGSAAWYGIKAANSSNLTISRCTIQPDEGGGAFTGTMTAIDLNACSLGVFSGNYIGVGNDIGYNLNNCTGGIVDQTISAQSAAGNVLFNLTANTRLTSIGLYELVSSFTGTVLQKDGTIVGAIQMINKSFDLQNTGNVTSDMTRVNAAVDTKKWRTVVGTVSQSRQVVSDAGSGTNYEIVVRTGTNVDSIEWRADKFKFNNGPELFTGTGSPEGVVTAPVGSLYLNVAGGAGTTLFVKQSGIGNTGWAGK